MALQDILTAITHEADQRISTAQSDYKQRSKALREQRELAILDAQQRINEQKKRKMTQLKERAEAHAHMISRHALLQKKQELLNDTYSHVIDALADMPKDKMEAFLKTCLSDIKSKGVIHPAKGSEAILKKLAGDDQTIGDSIDARGGFLFIGAKEERDCTFEFLVHEVLRPATEVRIAHELFPSEK
jgi:vacuolar-type H+-ATPase subunit E/Vma4